jgi:hypothetical protein
MEVLLAEKKNLISKIQKLSMDHQREIFFILRKSLDLDNIDNDSWYTKNQNGIFINLAIIDDNIIKDINIFVDECKNSKDKMKKLQKEILSIENQEICYKMIDTNNYIDSEDFNDIYTIMNTKYINEIIENIRMNKKIYKKNSLQTKFVNATKRYTKSINAEKKTEEPLIFFLDYEKYNIIK